VRGDLQRNSQRQLEQQEVRLQQQCLLVSGCDCLITPIRTPPSSIRPLRPRLSSGPGCRGEHCLTQVMEEKVKQPAATGITGSETTRAAPVGERTDRLNSSLPLLGFATGCA
jgi:hypothetical protein